MNANDKTMLMVRDEIQYLMTKADVIKLAC